MGEAVVFPNVDKSYKKRKIQVYNTNQECHHQHREQTHPSHVNISMRSIEESREICNHFNLSTPACTTHFNFMNRQTESYLFAPDFSCFYTDMFKSKIFSKSNSKKDRNQGLENHNIQERLELWH